MSEWEETSLGSLIDVKHGFAFSGEYISEMPCENILLTPGNFAIGGGFKGDKFKYYYGSIPEDFLLKSGDLLITMTDLSKQSDTLGYPAFVPSEANKNFLHNQRLGKVILKDGADLDIRYLNYLLRRQDYRHEILASATGTSIKHTSPERIKRFKFYKPPLPEQKAIASILSALDDKIELNRRMNETLEAMARAIFKDWFIDFGPTRAKQEGRAAYLPEQLWSLFPEVVDLDTGLPVGWEKKSLDEIADFLNGLALQKYPPLDNEDSLPVIKIAELRAGITEKSGRASRQIPEKYIVKDGDFLFSWSGSLVARFWTEGEGALNQHLFKVTSPNYPTWFYTQWVYENLEDFQRIAASKATTMGHIQRGHLTAAKVICPQSDLMNPMSDLMTPLVRKTIENNLESRTLAELRDRLLPKLMSGEIRVKDAQKTVEDAV